MIRRFGRFLRSSFSSRLGTRLFAGLAALALCLTSGEALAVGGKPAEKLVNVVDTRALSGFSKWLADVYNANLWLYGAMVVLIMVGMGLVLGFGMDRVMGLLGIDLGKIEHHE